jgi:hypothetical protein
MAVTTSNCSAREWQMLRHCYLKLDIRVVLLGPGPGRINHSSGPIDTHNDRTTLCKFERTLSVTASHVKNSAADYVADEFKHQPTFEPLSFSNRLIGMGNTIVELRSPAMFCRAPRYRS